MMRMLPLLAALGLLLAFSTAVAAQEGAVVDRKYEATKAVELEALKLQLVSSTSPTALADLNQAEDALRRLREAKEIDRRRKIANELEAALTRLQFQVTRPGLSR